MKAKLKALTQKKIFSLILLFVAMCVIFTVWAAIRNTKFLTGAVFINILNSMVVSGFLTLGAGTLLIAGYMDLSLASIGAFSGMVLAVAINGWNMHWIVGVILAIVLAAILGTVNAFMVTKLHFPAFIATLGMASMAKGLMYLISSYGNGNGQAGNVKFTDDAIDFICNGKIGPIQLGIIIMVIFFIIYGILIAKTTFGAKITLLGGGPVAATLAGINATKLIFILFINGAVMGTFSGIFYAGHLMQASVAALTNNQFTGMTAAILGGISFGGGVGGMGGAFIGLLILNTFQIGMQIVGLNPYWVNVCSGILLLVALAVDFIAQTRKQKSLG